MYKNGDHDFLNLVKRDDLDAVYIATPWEWHHPMAIAAMQEGKHVGTECPAALTVSDLWDLVNTSERVNRHCMLMENSVRQSTQLNSKSLWFRIWNLCHLVHS